MTLSLTDVFREVAAFQKPTRQAGNLLREGSYGSAELYSPSGAAPISPECEKNKVRRTSGRGNSQEPRCEVFLNLVPKKGISEGARMASGGRASKEGGAGDSAALK